MKSLLLFVALTAATPVWAGPFVGLQGDTNEPVAAGIGYRLGKVAAGVVYESESGEPGAFLVAFRSTPSDSAGVVNPYLRVQVTRDGAMSSTLGTLVWKAGPVGVATEAGVEGGEALARVWLVLALNERR